VSNKLILNPEDRWLVGCYALWNFIKHFTIYLRSWLCSCVVRQVKDGLLHIIAVTKGFTAFVSMRHSYSIYVINASQ